MLMIQLIMAKSSDNPVHIAAIDGLRAIAALAVLAYHIHHAWLPGGFAGVDLFFVISGFVIARSTSRIDVADSGAMVTAFYRKRFVRILPTLVVCLLVAHLMMVLFVPVSEPVGVADLATAGAALGLSNIILWQEAGDYFSPALDYLPTTHTWSLGVEEQFYLILPFIAFALWRLPRGSAGRNAARAIVGALTVASLLLALWLTPRSPTFAFYLLPTRLWELGAGVLLALRFENTPQLQTSRRFEVLAFAALLMLMAALAGLFGGAFPLPGALPVVAASVALVFCAAYVPDARVMRLLSLPLLRYFGAISYALYLWHMPVIVVLRWTIGFTQPTVWAFAALLSWLLADLTTRWIERPVRNSLWISGKSDGALTMLGLATMALTALAIHGMTLARPHLSLSVSRDASVWNGEAEAAPGRCKPDRVQQDLPGHGGMVQLTPTGCTASRNRLFVIGDSHAWSYQRMLGNLAAQQGMASQLAMIPGCPVLALNPGGVDCIPFTNTALAQVLSDGQAGDVLFLPGLRSARYRDFWQDDLATPAPPIVYDDAAMQAEADRLKPLLDKGIRIIIEMPKPVWPTAPMRCADWFNRANPACRAAPLSLAEAQAHRALALAAIGRLQALEPRLKLWDPFSLLCHADPCPAWQNGKPLVRDGDHLSAYANDQLTPYFWQVLAQ